MYATRQYDVRLLLAAPGAPALWDYAIWQSLAPALTPLLSSDRGRTSLRMHQIDTRNTGVPNQAYVRFGQIGWNDKSHRKWTHSSPDTAGVSGAWDFGSFSAWSPGPSKCAACPPDGLLAVKSQLSLGSGIGRSNCRFSYSVLAAAACDVPQAETVMDSAFSRLREEIPAVLEARTCRPWQHPFRCARTGTFIAR